MPEEIPLRVLFRGLAHFGEWDLVDGLDQVLKSTGLLLWAQSQGQLMLLRLAERRLAANLTERDLFKDGYPANSSGPRCRSGRCCSILRFMTRLPGGSC
jgi:hypothetical protein